MSKYPNIVYVMRKQGYRVAKPDIPHAIKLVNPKHETNPVLYCTVDTANMQGGVLFKRKGD